MKNLWSYDGFFYIRGKNLATLWLTEKPFKAFIFSHKTHKCWGCSGGEKRITKNEWKMTMKCIFLASQITTQTIKTALIEAQKINILFVCCYVVFLLTYSVFTKKRLERGLSRMNESFFDVSCKKYFSTWNKADTIAVKHFPVCCS